MPEGSVCTLILNTNRRADTLACLASLAASTYANNTIIVLDNASTDGSPAAIRAAYPSVRVVALPENRGYAGNNNVGLTLALASGADWALVLNEDTLLAPDCVAQLAAAGAADARIGLAGPLVYHADEPTVIQSAGGMLDPAWRARHLGQNAPDQGQYSAARDVNWLSGCALFVRRAVLEQVGLLDASYFYFWEETEWCLRAARAGWRIRHVPAARLWHKGVQRSYQPRPSVTYYATRNRLRTLAKHHAPLRAWLAAGGEVTRTLASWTLRPRYRDKRAHRAALWQAVVDFARGRMGPAPAAITRAP
ncbi:MAG: glycosyltransferase family 2 protein [Anaerolineales bacterium]|nr:glycosyltransferase family 2 protein [Anaerolineales bacterium]